MPTEHLIEVLQDSARPAFLFGSTPPREGTTEVRYAWLQSLQILVRLLEWSIQDHTKANAMHDPCIDIAICFFLKSSSLIFNIGLIFFIRHLFQGKSKIVMREVCSKKCCASDWRIHYIRHPGREGSHEDGATLSLQENPRCCMVLRAQPQKQHSTAPRWTDSLISSRDRYASLFFEETGKACVVYKSVVEDSLEGFDDWLSESVTKFGHRTFNLVGAPTSSLQYKGPTLLQAMTHLNSKKMSMGCHFGCVCIPERELLSNNKNVLYFW